MLSESRLKRRPPYQQQIVILRFSAALSSFHSQGSHLFCRLIQTILFLSISFLALLLQRAAGATSASICSSRSTSSSPPPIHRIPAISHSYRGSSSTRTVQSSTPTHLMDRAYFQCRLMKSLGLSLSFRGTVREAAYFPARPRTHQDK